jgi:hypothetical protein
MENHSKDRLRLLTARQRHREEWRETEVAGHSGEGRVSVSRLTLMVVKPNSRRVTMVSSDEFLIKTCEEEALVSFVVRLGHQVPPALGNGGVLSDHSSHMTVGTGCSQQ